MILFVYEKISHLSGGSKAGHAQHVMPLHNKSFLISCSFWPNVANFYVVRPPPGVGTTPRNPGSATDLNNIMDYALE